MMRKILLFSILSSVLSYTSFSAGKPPGGGGGSTSCPRLEGIKGCKPKLPPPPPACTPPDPNAGQPCTGTMTTCTTGSMDVAQVTPGTCLQWECVPNYCPPSETPEPCGCTNTCTGGYSPDTCAVVSTSCDTCTSAPATGVIDNCGSCVVSGSANPGMSCGANQTCP